MIDVAAAPSPFHAGELAVQRRVGVAEQMDGPGRRAIRSYLTDQHRRFFAQLPFLLAGARDPSGQPWATILVGRPGFASSPDPLHLRVEARPPDGDPIAAELSLGAAVGLLGIELPTRRRNRLNGTVTESSETGFTVEVGQSFGNCPKYIQTRTPRFIADPAPAAVVQSDRLDADARRLIGGADTFFIASASTGGVDLSHRGGRPGFVRIDDDRLTVPDFAGNFYFNTLGNLVLEPRAGLLFVDFDSGDLLSVAVRAEIVWDGPEVAAFVGAERLLRLRVTEIVRRAGALPLRFSAPEFSPVLGNTGIW